MKLTFLVTLFLVAISSKYVSCISEDEARFSPNSVILLLVEMFRGLVLNGDERNNVPITDPFIFDINQFQLDGIFVQVDINATNGVLTGLGRLNVETLSFSTNDMSADIKITIPKLKLEADHYELFGSIFGVLPISGSGLFYATAYDFVINTRVYFKPSVDGRAVQIDHLENTNFTIAKIVSLTQYDKNIDHIVNAIIEDTLAQKLTKFSSYLSATYQGKILDALNPMIAAYDTWTILTNIL